MKTIKETLAACRMVAAILRAQGVGDASTDAAGRVLSGDYPLVSLHSATLSEVDRHNKANRLPEDCSLSDVQKRMPSRRLPRSVYGDLLPALSKARKGHPGAATLNATGQAQVIELLCDELEELTDDGYRPAYKLYDLDARVGDTKLMLKFLDSHPEIPNHPKGKRRMVHVAKLIDVLNATSPLNQVDKNDVLVGVVERYGEVKKGSKPQK